MADFGYTRSFSHEYNNNSNFAPKMLDQFLGQQMEANRTLSPQTIMLQTAMFGGGGGYYSGSNSNSNSNSSSSSHTMSRSISTGGWWSSRGIF